MSASVTDRTPDTPRTDAQVWIVKEGGFVKGDHIKGETEVVGAPIARQLERELIVAEGLEQMAYEQRNAAFGELKLLHDLLDRAYKMMQMAGYRVVEQNADHNNPIIAWMADARSVIYGNTKPVPKL